MRALTNVFSDATGEVVENAVTAANSLPSLDRCADVPLLRAIIEPPSDTTARAKVPELRRRGAEIKARFDAGRFKETLKETPELLAEARVVGYRPVLAETLLRVGSMYAKAGDLAEAEKALTESFWVADSSRHDEVRAEAAANLVFVVGYRQARFEEGHRWATAADSILERIGGHDVLRAWLLNDLGLVHHLEGDEDRAVQAMRRALAVKEKALGPDHPDVSRSEVNLGMFLQALGKHQEALAHLNRARAAEEKTLGRSHPEVAVALVNTGEILSALGRNLEARHAYERAGAIWEAELGPNHLDLAFALTGIGLSYLADGNASAALVPLERAHEIRQAQEKQLATRAETSFALARALWESRRDRARARTLAELAKADYVSAPSGARKVAEVENWIRLRMTD
jgi:tetratricopeptide (TPR) repeat protein